MIPAEAHWIRLPRFVGDAILMHQAATPLLAEGLPLVAWGPAATVELFQGSQGYVGVCADPAKKTSLLEGARLLRAHRPASVLALAKSLRAPAAAFAARVPRRVGCGDGGASLLLTASLKYWSRDDHSLDRYRDIVRLGYPELEEPGFRPFRPREESLACVAAARRDQDLDRDPYLAFAIGAAAGAKRLGLDLLVDLAHRTLAAGFRIVVLGGPGDDVTRAEAFRQRVPEALDLTARIPWSQSAAWLAGARAVLANDSGLAHLAAVVGAPVVAVFGPTIPRHTAPRGPKVTVVRKEDLACLECQKWHCPLPDHPCMTQVPASLIWSALEVHLATPVPEAP
ncbi:glycosyltransferase family 9 protein [Geothrix oryzisoli]|uniref:glycosyltransferase family 9 protein n=1 Tax=Geothrix oryzisoli TaxID=2922721 RepID=UPI001FAC3010|nr:glycosyltransferase family 9 protein [Geothrix oryzisoli]